MRKSSAHLRLVEAPEQSSARQARAFEVTEEVLAELRRGEAGAQRGFVQSMWPRVTRTLRSVLGAVHDLDDLAQEVFIRAFDRIDRVQRPESLRPFVMTTTLFVARESIRARTRKRWLVFSAPEELPELALPGASPEVLAALEAFYRAVSELALDDRLAFLLRHVEGMELTEIAAATSASLSTVKRRLARADAAFIERSASDPELARLMEEGAKWHVVRA